MDVDKVGRMGGLLVMLSTSIYVLSVESATLGDEEYRKTLDAVEFAQQENKEPREISDIYSWGAGKCRDAGGNATTIELFESAISEDPTNARAHMLYADYLMGYRGLYEHAAAHYYSALEIVEKDATSYDDAFKKSLERSMQILHRDGRDGVPIITSKKFSMFVSGDIRYGYPTPSVSSVIGGNRSINTSIDGRQQEILDGIAFTAGTIAENMDGINRTEGLIAENMAGIARTEEQIISNSFGIAFFENRLLGEIEERAEWIPMLESLLVENGGEVTDRNEPIDQKPDGTDITINSAIAAHNMAIQTTSEQIQGAEEEKATNLANIQVIEDDKATNVQILLGIEQDKSNNEAIQAERKEEIKENERFRKQRERDLTEANRTFERGLDLLFRFGEPRLPFFRLKFRRTEIDEGFFFAGDENNFDRLFDTDSTLVSGSAAKNFLVTPELSLFLEAELARRENRVEDPAQNNRRVFKERADEIALKAEFGKKSGFNTALFKLSGSVADIENDDTNDDDSFRVTTSVRLSSFPPATKIKNDSRFRGQRSHHLEFGAGYVERDFTSNTDPTVTESSYTPFVSWEELGILRGFMDVVTVYQSAVPDKSADPDNDGTTVHRFTVIPTMIPVYKLYDNDFWTGHELVTIGFPISYAYSKTDFDRFSAGIRVEDRLVTRLHFALRSTLSATFSHYPEINHDEWAAFAQVKVNFGAQRKFRGANRVKR